MVGLSSLCSSALSRTVTSAPSATSRSAAAVPLKASAQYRDVLVFVSSILPQLQCCQAEQGKDSGKNPKAHDDGVFLPAAQFEMMMDGRHREDAFARQLETEHLQNDGDGFDHEHAADDGEEQFLFAANRDYANQSADCERTRVAHENFRGVTVEPEEAQSRSDQRGTNHSEFAGEWIKRHLQVFRDPEIPGE